MAARPQPHLPADPLLELVGPKMTRSERGTAGCDTRLGNRVGTPNWVTATIKRARRDGYLTVWAADHLAVEVFKLHPAEIWGEQWFEDV